MSVGIDNSFDEILTRDGNVFFVDKLWVKSLSDDNWVETLNLHHRLKQISEAQAESFFRIDIKDLTCEKFIKHLIGENDLSKAIDDSSDYSVFMDAFSQLKPGVLVFYRTHSISSDLLRLISKLVKHAQQNNLGWKFAFYGKAKKLTHIIKERLFIEHYYPEEYQTTSQVSKRVVSDNNLLDNPTARGLTFIKGMLVVSALVIAGTSIYFAGQQSSISIDNQLIINDTTGDVDLDKKNEPSVSQSSFESNQTIKEMIEESKLQALEFEKAMAEFNAAQALEINLRQDKDNSSESIKTANNQDQNVRLLSIDVEKAIAANDLAFLQSFSDKQMLAYGQDSKGETPLTISVNNGSDQIVRWLLQQNVPVDSRDSYGRTALFYAAIKGNESFIKLLLQAGAQVSLGSNLSKTPLMAAVHNNHYESARLLLVTQKAQVNTQDHSGWSALFYAVWNSNPQMANLLLEFGADTDLIDTSGLNVDQVASAAGFSEWKSN